MDYPPNQSVWGRAKKDTISAQSTVKFMWIGGAVLAVAGGTWLPLIALESASNFELVARAVLGGLIGLLVALLVFFVWNLFSAPYKQRNESRIELSNLQRQIEAFNDTHPNIIYESPDTTLYQEHYYLRLKFKNNVAKPSGDISTSKDTIARIEVYSSDNILVDDWDGRWADSDPPQQYGDISKLNKLDINANETARLDIGVRAIGHVQFKGHHNRHPESPEEQRKLLDPGSYYTYVRLSPSNARPFEFRFALEIPNTPQSSDLGQVKITPIPP